MIHGMIKASSEISRLRSFIHAFSYLLKLPIYKIVTSLPLKTSPSFLIPYSLFEDLKVGYLPLAKTMSRDPLKDSSAFKSSLFVLGIIATCSIVEIRHPKGVA